MNIVILDDIEINGRQLESLREYGDLRVCSGVPSDTEEVVSRAGEAEIILCGWTEITEQVLKKLPNLRFISLWATGYDNINVNAATQNGIVVSNVPGYAENAVAELAIGLMLSVIRKITRADKDMRKKPDINWNPYQGLELKGKTLGVIGTGAIGARVANIARCFGMKLIGSDRYPKDELVNKLGFKYLELNEVLRDCDIATIHLPLNKATNELITGREIALMKDSTIIINTARAGIIEQDSLYEVLERGRIYGAGLDDIDFSQESGKNLLKLDNVVATPHIGFNTREAIEKKTDVCIENVIRYLHKRPINVVN